MKIQQKTRWMLYTIIGLIILNFTFTACKRNIDSELRVKYLLVNKTGHTLFFDKYLLYKEYTFIKNNDTLIIDYKVPYRGDRRKLDVKDLKYTIFYNRNESSEYTVKYANNKCMHYSINTPGNIFLYANFEYSKKEDQNIFIYTFTQEMADKAGKCE